MNSVNCGKQSSQKAVVLFTRALVIAGILFSAMSGLAQGLIPTPPPGRLLNIWEFDTNTWRGAFSTLPISYTNIDQVEDWSGTALQVDSTNAAWLQYHVVESNNRTNLTCVKGTVQFWFVPNWSSNDTNQNGTGPGDYGRFIDVGKWTNDASLGWWSLYLNSDGTSITFSSQSDGQGTNYLSAPISWDSATWHLISLTYSTTNTALYIDGELAVSGDGVLYVPNARVLTNGFFVGSDNAGMDQIHGQMDVLQTFNYPLDPTDIADDFDYENPNITLTAGTGGSHTMDSGGMFPGGGGDTGGGTTSNAQNSQPYIPDYGTNLWMAQICFSNGWFNSIISNTAADIQYEIQFKQDLMQPDWNSADFIYGSELTNWTAWSGLEVNLTNNAFFRIRSWISHDGSGLPDWWELKYFGQTGIDPYASAAGDGLSNLQKFQMGLNPTNYYYPYAPTNFYGCFDATGTNLVLEWDPAPGPVINYIVQKGIYNTNTSSYDYSQFVVNSNNTFFVDAGAISNNTAWDDNAWNDVYYLQAVYPGGTLTASNTWYANYIQYGFSGPPYSGPVPGDFYAYVGASRTNVLLSWTLARGATNYLVFRGILDPNTYNYNYTQIATLNTNTTLMTDVGVIIVNNDWNDVYEIEAVYPGNGLSQPVTVGISTNPPPPTGVSAAVDPTGTNVVISWTAPQSVTATGYTIERGVYNISSGTYVFTTIGTVNADTTLFQDTGAITGNSSYNNTYVVTAGYSGGASSSSGSASLPSAPVYNSLHVTANLVRNETGRWQLMFSALPANAQTINLIGFGGGIQNISTNLLTNGIYQFPDNYTVNYATQTPATISVQCLDANGNAGTIYQAGIFPNDAPYFVDGRQHMKQNLKFLVRGASMNKLLDTFLGQILQTNTDFEEFSFLHPADFEGTENPYYFQLEALWPFIANYKLEDFLVNNSSLAQNIPNNLISASPYLYTNQFEFQLDFNSPVPAPAVLDKTDPYWINQMLFLDYWYYQGYEPSSPSEWGVTVDNSDTTIGLSSGSHNLFGLPFYESIIGEYTNRNNGLYFSYQELAPGNSITLLQNYSIGQYCSWCPEPDLALVNYYFAPLIIPRLNYIYFSGVNLPGEQDAEVGSGHQPYILPIMDDFKVTNQTPPLIIGAVGQPMIIGGWAKYSIQNGNPNKFAYLGQYFVTNAYLMTNGLVTANKTGVVSPYGEFFPTEPGVVALTTMPDIDPPYSKGTCAVTVVSLNVDKNHDGTMDLTFSGADVTSQSSPMICWVNNGYIQPGSNGSLDKDLPVSGNNANYSKNIITCQRDLENFFRLWICGMPAIPVNQGYSVKLSFQNTSKSPAVKLYWSCESDGGTKYLTDTATAAMQTLNISDSGYGVSIHTVSSSQPYTFPDGTFQFGGKRHLLFEGAGIGSGELVLTIIDNNSNTLVQTGVWLDLHDVKDFYERTVIANVVNGQSMSGVIKTEQYASVSALGSDTDFIVFVHGFNVGDWDWLNDSDTVFKRLYWAGFNGQFTTVKWPCQIGDPLLFDLSELDAYKASTGLATYLNQLRSRFPSYRLNILAHSQGNAITSETIRNQGAPFDTYILTQGAMPASSYDANAPIDPDLLNQETYFPTPDWQPMGYHGAFTNLTGRIISFYNPVDFALQTGTTWGLPTNWKQNQTLKPEGPYSSDGIHVWDDGMPVTDTEMSRAFAARSRTDAVGATAGLGGVIKSSVDLNAQFQFGRTLDEHSAQWTRPIQTSYLYYKQVLTQIQPAP